MDFLNSDSRLKLDMQFFADAEQQGVVDPEEMGEGTESAADELETEEPLEEEAEEEGEDGGNAAAEPQPRAQNDAAKAARIRAQRETAERLQREYDERIAGMGVINPYTNQPFRNFSDFESYARRFQQEQLEARAKKEGKTPEELQEEEENRRYVRQKRLEEQQARTLQSRAQKDYDEFSARYPGENVARVLNDRRFQRFAGKRLGNEPLADLYGDFLAVVGEISNGAAARAESRKARGTGGGGAGAEGLSPQESQQLAEWNRRYPELKMTPSEWRKR